MKRIFIAFFAAIISLGAAAQELTEAQKAAAEAARTISQAPEAKPEGEKRGPGLWARGGS